MAEETTAPPPLAAVDDEQTDEAIELDEPAHVDPWEQEAQLPDVPDVEDEPPEPEPSRRFSLGPAAFEEAEPVVEEPEAKPEPELEEQGPLPIDTLSEQAAAATERSRARRRAPRRARRR